MWPKPTEIEPKRYAAMRAAVVLLHRLLEPGAGAMWAGELGVERESKHGDFHAWTEFLEHHIGGWVVAACPGGDLPPVDPAQISQDRYAAMCVALLLMRTLRDSDRRHQIVKQGELEGVASAAQLEDQFDAHMELIMIPPEYFPGGDGAE